MESLGTNSCGKVIDNDKEVMLFSNEKVDTSFGKRSANLKRVAFFITTIDNDKEPKHGRASLCNKANTHKNSTEEACSETGDSSKTEKLTETLSKSLALFNMQALEKERQKNNFLKEQILRDQGVALSRKQNLISQQYSTLLNRHPTDNMALEATEKSIDEIDVSNKCFGDQTDFAAGYQDSATITSNQKSP